MTSTGQLSYSQMRFVIFPQPSTNYNQKNIFLSNSILGSSEFQERPEFCVLKCRKTLSSVSQLVALTSADSLRSNVEKKSSLLPHL